MEKIANDKNWKALIKPSKVDVKTHDSKSIATITAEPLEKGYGLTIGNSLRRIMLSSIRGSAVTAIQIDGVLHEFSSIKGVREDVTDIVLNVKSLSIQVMSDEPKKLILDVKGPGEIKAKDIQTNPDVKILNPDLVLCHLDENTKFHMELIASNGKGYRPAEKNKKEDVVKEEPKIDISKTKENKKEQIQISDNQNDDPPVKLVGLYDPGKNDLSLEMWSGTDGQLIRDSIKRIEKIKLSKFSEEIFLNTILTYSYPPKKNLSQSEFLKLKINFMKLI